VTETHSSLLTRSPVAPAEPSSQPSVPLPLILIAGLLLPLALAYGLATENELKVIAIVIGCLGVALIVWQPFFGLLLLVGLIYVRVEELIPALAGMRLTLIISGATLVAAAVQCMLRKTRLVRNPIVEMLFAFAAVATISGASQGYPVSTADEMGKLVLMSLLVLNLVRTPDRYRTLVTALILFTTYLAIFSIVRYFTGGAMLTAGIERSQGTGIFSDPNDLAAGVVFGLALTLARMPNSRWPARIMYSVMALVMIAAIFFTHSRGGLVATAVVIVVFCISISRNRAAATLAAVIALAGLLAVAPSRMREFDASEESANSRFELWLDGLEELKGSPLFGMGFRQFSEQSPDNLTAHNSFVLAFSELGLVGYFFFIGCLYYALRRPKEHGRVDLEPAIERDYFGARLALAGFLVAAFFISRTYVQVTWLFVFLAVASQIVTGAGSDNFRFQPNERLRDWTKIGAICIGSIILIKLISHVLA
jgi:putative inorganic carbon (hco3(-)) transporter